MTHNALTILSRGFGLAAAQEMALKIRESAGMPASSASTYDVRHGPAAAVGSGDAVIFLDLGKNGDRDADVLARQLATPGASVRWYRPRAEAVPEYLRPILAVVLGQHLAVALSQLRGRDADRPMGLTKVTPTR